MGKNNDIKGSQYMKKRCFIISIGPSKQVAKYKAAQAANNFCFNLIDNNAFDKSFSMVPAHLYDSEIWKESNDNIEYLYGNPRFPLFLRKIQLLWINILCALKAKDYENIWFYNIIATNIICFLILKYLFRKHVFTILLDYTPEPSRFKMQHYYISLLERAEGTISLSARVDLRQSNLIVKAGVMSKDKIKPFVRRSTRSKPVFLFCGNLRIIAGYPLLIEVFKDLPEVELYITGKNPSAKVDFSKHPNIHYISKYLDYEEFLQIYDKIDVCLSFRDPRFPENMYNFPSKIIEFFAYNKVVISTMEYPELKGFKYIHCEYNKDAVIKEIREILRWDNNTLDEYSDNQKQLKELFSVESWISAFSSIENNVNHA